MAKVFLDNAYVIAVASPSDEFHTRAEQLATWIEVSKISVVTTRAVLLEVGNALSRQRSRQKAVEILTLIENDSAVEIVPLTDNLYVSALNLF